MEQTDYIKELLFDIEKRYNITILYAIESGSRAWGFESDDSDFDIRFIYKHNDFKKYLTIGKRIETIDGFSEDRIYDWSGWDITKAIKHLKESNPSIIEWLYSSIKYIDNIEFRNECCNLLNKMHTKLSLLHHYKSMAYTNWMDHMYDKELVNIKKYFYVIRPITMMDMLLHTDDKQSLSDYMEINFNIVLDKIKSNLSKETYDAIINLLEKKRSLHELGNGRRIVDIDNWILSIFNEFDKITSTDKQFVNEQSTITLYKKIKNEYKKLITIQNKRDKISRNDYLSAIGFCLQFLWLKNNSERNYRNIPTHICHILNEFDLDSCEIPMDMRNEIIKIIETREDIIEIDEQLRTIDKETLYNIFVKDGLLKICDVLMGSMNSNEFYLSDDLVHKLEKMKEGKIIRCDFIEYNIKHYICSLIWLLENENYTIRQIPKDDIISKINVSDKFKERLECIIDENKVKYKMEFNELINNWIKDIIDKNKEFIEIRTKEHLHIRDDNIKVRYENSLKNIDQNEFDILLHKFILN